MKDRKKSSDRKTDQKRLFLRMKSPSTFGAARRFDSASFMNVPPEMARRDAAYQCFADFFRSCNVNGKSPADRRQLYDRILKLFGQIEERSEFILNSDLLEKRNLESAEILTFIRIIQRYFLILSNLAAAQIASPAAVKSGNGDSLISGGFFDVLNSQLYQYEDSIVRSVLELLNQKRSLLLAQKEQRRKLFSKSDSERYERAFSMYLEYYNGLKNI